MFAATTTTERSTRLPAGRVIRPTRSAWETTADGHCKAFFGGSLVAEDDLTPVGGAYVGLAQQWNRTNYASTVPNLGTSPRFESVTYSGGTNTNETTNIATMWSSSYDGIGGSQLSVTPRVIQACFQPEGTYNTWWYGDGSAPTGLTPRGCVMPLVTAASATATAADEPWQKQFFRQIGLNTVSFTDGVGTIPVPVGMGLPAVVNAQVDGVTAGGIMVAQARRTSDNAITVALNSAHDGDVEINWSVDAAVITFGTPPPSIDTIRNPGSSYGYGPQVEYDVGGGAWPFELVSWGSTLVDGCVLKDFTGATVGGPFTVIPSGGGIEAHRVLWDAGRNWYLPAKPSSTG